MCSDMEKEILFSIIDMYKDMPYLWKKDHSEYMKKNVRDEGFNVLLEIYKKIDEKATIKTVKKKIENMRTNYLKELKKVLTSKHTGSEPDEVYVPTLWYYKKLSFLGNRTESSRSDSLENENLSSDDENVRVASSYRGQKRKEKETFLEKQGEILETAEKLLTKLSQNDEQWEAYGRSIGYQIKDLNNNQLMVCQKIISDAIFCAKLNKLNENSHIVSPSNKPTLHQRHFESSPSTYSTELTERSIPKVILDPYKLPVEFGCEDVILPQERAVTAKLLGKVGK